MRARHTIPGLALLLCTLWAVQALAYVRTRTTNSRAQISWVDTSCIFIRINANGSEDIKDGSDIVGARRAINNWRWQTMSCAYIQFQELPSTKDAKIEFNRQGENENVIAWRESDWPKDKAGAIALTNIFFIDKDGHSKNGMILDADIELNGVQFTFATDGSPEKSDVENTVVHELGHLLGLDHPCDDRQAHQKDVDRDAGIPDPTDHTGARVPECLAAPKSVRDTTMYAYADKGETKKRTLEPDDIAGICAIYPQAKDPGVCSRTSVPTENSGCSVGRTPAGGREGGLLMLGLMLLALRRRRA